MKLVIRIIKIIASVLAFFVGGVVLTVLSRWLPGSGLELLTLCGSPKGFPLSYVGGYPDATVYTQPICGHPAFFPAAFMMDIVFWAVVVGLWVLVVKRRRKRSAANNSKSPLNIVVITILGILIIPVSGKAIVRFDLENLRAQNADYTRAYDLINVQNAWEKVLDAAISFEQPVVIGVVDTGIDATHQEFNDPEVLFGSSQASALSDSAPDGHGTKVAGIIAANNVSNGDTALPSNSPQMNGILSGILSEPQYILESENLFSHTMGSITALENLVSRNLTVVNMSFGAPKCSSLSLAQKAYLKASGMLRCFSNDGEFTNALLAYSRIFNKQDNKDILFIAAAGNWGIDAADVLPAALDFSNVLTVGATDFEDHRAVFVPLGLEESSYGTVVGLSVPTGELGVYAPKPGEGYDIPGRLLGSPTGFSGTSAAAPFVTGVAGLIKAVRSGLTPAQIKQILIETADPIQTGESDKRLGTGCYVDPNDPLNTGCRLNAHRAVCHPLVLGCDSPTPT